jgi:hypothetical protein
MVRISDARMSILNVMGMMERRPAVPLEVPSATVSPARTALLEEL